MTALPDIPRLYTALAECLAVLLVTPALMPRFSKAVTVGVTLLWAAGLSAFLGLTGNEPGGLWIPCMVTAIGFSYLYLWGVWSITLLEAGYHCARAFILAELAASVEWQLHCALWPARGPWEPLSLLLLALVYGALFGIMCYLQPVSYTHLDVYKRQDRPCDPCLPRQHPAAASGLHPCGRRGSTEPAVNSQSQLLHLP